MSTKATIWHNPRCSKSRQTLNLLREHGVDVFVRRYLDDPPDKAELTEVLESLDMLPIELIRKSEPAFEEMQLADSEVEQEDLIEAMVKHPILIERPIVLVETSQGKRARVGRPPQNVLSLFDVRDQ